MLWLQYCSKNILSFAHPSCEFRPITARRRQCHRLTCLVFRWPVHLFEKMCDFTLNSNSFLLNKGLTRHLAIVYWLAICSAVCFQFEDCTMESSGSKDQNVIDEPFVLRGLYFLNLNYTLKEAYETVQNLLESWDRETWLLQRTTRFTRQQTAHVQTNMLISLTSQACQVTNLNNEIIIPSLGSKMSFWRR